MNSILLLKNKCVFFIFLILCTCAVSRYLGGVYYYIILLTLSSFFIFQQKNKKIYPNCLAIIIIAILSTLINYFYTPSVFRPISRTVLLIIVMVASAPIFNSSIIYEFRHKLFGGLAVGLTVVGVVSAYLATRGWGHFGESIWIVGLSDFPNSLGYSLAVSVMFLSSNMSGAKWYIKMVIILLIGLCVWAVPLTGTRTALYSLPLFYLVYIFLVSKNLANILKHILVVGVLGGLFFSVVDLDMTIINRKNEAQTFLNNSRTSLLQDRIREFAEHPILGIGTFVADTRWTPVNDNGNIEAGNTFLMFLSMNGALGFVNFMIMYLSLIFPFVKYIINRRRRGMITRFEIFLSSIVLYNFISMMQMGILLNPGMYITAFNWLTLSLMYKPGLYLKNTDPNISYLK